MAAAERELAAALAAVRAASALCADTQRRLVAGDVLVKGDESPVTVADFAAQAVVSATLVEALGDIDLVGEEDPADLADEGAADLLSGVAELVGRQLGRVVSAPTVVDWIGRGGADGMSGRFWTLDPIDGTKGFLRGDQYAIALALVEDGEVVLGVLGCPNLPNPDGSVGAVFAAASGRCEAWYGPVTARPTDSVVVRVARPSTLSEARVCESVEAGHSDHELAARITEQLGIVAAPYRIDSQCKYAAVARGDASIYLRLPTRPGYHEKIWDHAAGKFVVEQAGGRVTDVDGEPLDFSHGRRLERNRGVIATDGSFHDEVVAAVSSALAG